MLVALFALGLGPAGWWFAGGPSRRRIDLMQMIGEVTSGRGLATGSLAVAREQMADMLGARPYPGTLNILLRRPVEFCPLRALRPDNYPLGRHSFWRGKVLGRNCLLFRWPFCPLHVVEVISDRHLRSAFNITDGTKVLINCDDAAPVGFVNNICWTLLWAGRRRNAYTSETYQRHLWSRVRLLARKAGQPQRRIRRAA